MNPDTLIWVCLPQRVDVLSGSTTLHLAVAIQPQLQSSTLGAAGLAGWPPRELAGAMLQADIGATVDAVHTLSGTVQLVANPALWPVLFPPTTPVASSVQGAGDTRTLMVDPTASQARAAREVFEAAAAVHVPADGDGVVAMANLHRTVGAALAASPFTRAARDAAACYRKRLVPIAPRTAASPVLAEAPVDPTHEFHRTVAFMREHPVAMRALGLVFDVSIVVPAATELANAGVVRLRWTEAPCLYFVCRGCYGAGRYTSACSANQSAARGGGLSQRLGGRVERPQCPRACVLTHGRLRDNQSLRNINPGPQRGGGSAVVSPRPSGSLRKHNLSADEAGCVARGFARHRNHPGKLGCACSGAQRQNSTGPAQSDDDVLHADQARGPMEDDTN